MQRLPGTPTLWSRAAAIAWVALVLSIALLVLIPMLAVGIAVIIVAAAWIGLRALSARLGGDGRRNVRIVRRE